MFSTGSLVLQLSYLLLLIAAVTSRRLARLFIALSAAAALVHSLVWGRGMPELIWMGLILAACLVLFGRDWLSGGLVRFDAEEERMRSGFLAGVPRHVARHLIDRGIWLHGTVGDEITREGVPVERLVWLGSGEALVLSDGRQVATCRPGDLIGEASILTADPATATVVLAGTTRFWCMTADELRTLLDADEDLRAMLERNFARAVRTKLHASNRTIAAAGGIA